MKAQILYLLIWIFNLAFSQESVWNNSPLNKIRYPIFNRMTFRQPVVFTPFDIKVGYLYYGGKNYWSQLPYNSSDITVTDSPVLLDSTQYQFNVIEKISNRRGLFIEVDLLRTNLTHFIFHQNYIDLQMGLGIQMINYFQNPSLPSDTGKEWLENSELLQESQITIERGNYYFNPKAVGINLNTSLAWQFSRKRLTYIYHSLGISSVSLYGNAGGDRTLTGIGLSESFGIGTKYIFRQKRDDFNYTLGIEIKLNRLYMASADAIEGLSPIRGIDIRASGIFLTSGIQFGGRHTDGDIAYSQMMHDDFISALESFETFLDRETRHIKREKAIEMLEYCQSQIANQKFELGVDAYLRSDFAEALEWFDAAELDANEMLKKEIQNNRKNIALELFTIIENHNNEMSIYNAIILADFAKELYPGSERYYKIMAELYMDKAKLNTQIGNYSGAIDNYQKALKIYPEMETIITEKLHSIAKSLMKDAYLSYKENEIYMVIKSLKDFVQLQPQMDRELGPYILKLEKQIEDLHNENHSEQYITTNKYESFKLKESILRLGMTYEEAKSMHGTPKYINKHTEKNELFEMWTYPKSSDISHLYFRNNMLIRIEK